MTIRFMYRAAAAAGALLLIMSLSLPSLPLPQSFRAVLGASPICAQDPPPIDPEVSFCVKGCTYAYAHLVHSGKMTPEEGGEWFNNCVKECGFSWPEEE